MKEKTQHRWIPRLRMPCRPAALAALGLVVMMSSASAQMPGFDSDVSIEANHVGNRVERHVSRNLMDIESSQFQRRLELIAGQGSYLVFELGHRGL